MNYVSVSYTVKWRVSFAHNYQFTTCKKCINSKTGRELKKVLKNGMVGFNIKGKFYSLKNLRSHLELIPKHEIPF